jgi:plasmid maintenance system killer protein
LNESTCRAILRGNGSASFRSPVQGSNPSVLARRAAAGCKYRIAMQSLDEIPSLASVRLHKLKGSRKNQWAVAINGPWRIAFEFRNGDIFDVEIVDYH